MTSQVKQAEVAVSTSLPPQVQGRVRGYLEVSLPALLWECSMPPPASWLSVILAWWGQETQGTLFRVPVHIDKHTRVKSSHSRHALSRQCCQFPVHSSLASFKRYLQDIGEIVLPVGLGRMNSELLVLGQCTLSGFEDLDTNLEQPLKQSCPVSTPDGIYLGQLIVHMSLHWSRAKGSLSAPSQITTKMHRDLPVPHNSPQKTSPQPSMVQRVTEEEETKENEEEMNEAVEKIPSNGDSASTQRIKLARLRPMGTRDQLTESKEKRLVLPGEVLKSRECKNVVSELMERSKQLQRVMAECTQQPETAVSGCMSLRGAHFADDDGRTRVASDHVMMDTAESCSEMDDNSVVGESLLSLVRHALGGDGANVRTTIDKKEEEKDKVEPSVKLNRLPTILDMLLIVRDGRNLSLPASSSDPYLASDDDTVNPYLVYKVSPDISPAAIHSQISWQCKNPQFVFHKIVSLPLTDEVIMKMSSSSAVVEVWHCAAPREEDELIGLVKLSLSRFHTILTHSTALSLLMEAEHPAIAVDGVCPVINPLSGRRHGGLSLLLALGTPAQVKQLAQQTLSDHQVNPPPLLPHSGDQEKDDSLSQEMVQHMFELWIQSISGLCVPANAVWGEADCFIRYHFPSSSEEKKELSSKQFQTMTTLCTPDLLFNYYRRHTFCLSSKTQFSDLLVNSNISKVTFEVWARFYYPNVRDQLVAKAHLPTIKLAALCRNAASASRLKQRLLLQNASVSTPENKMQGTLEISVHYHQTQVEVLNEEIDQECVHLSLRILRAAGLKDAVREAVDNGHQMTETDQCSGVNTFIRVKFPFTSTTHLTKVVARSFAPEFCALLDVSLPLFVPIRAEHDGYIPHKQPIAQVMETSIMTVEIWHRRIRSFQGLSGKLTRDNRDSEPNKDVLLGVASVPMLPLVSTHKGITGWFPVYSRGHHHLSALPSSSCLAGVELSCSFPRESDRHHVIATAAATGWTPPPTLEPKLSDVFSEDTLWQFTIAIDSVQLPASSCEISLPAGKQYKSCFVRYKFFDKEPIVTAPLAPSCITDTRASYDLSSAVTAPYTCWPGPQLLWYLCEESLEVQVWLTVRLPGPDSDLLPRADDQLVGAAWIPLASLLNHREEAQIEGRYTLFIAGADSLAHQSMGIAIARKHIGKNEPHEQQNSDADVSDTSSCTSSSPELVQEPVKPPSDSFMAEIVISHALHLSLLSPADSEEESAPNAYVTYHPHPSLDRISTPVVPCSTRPVWDHHNSLLLPTSLLTSCCPGLEFQVWSELNAVNHDSGEDEEEVPHKFLGRAVVDLTPLRYGLAQISGWYNVVDLGGSVHGQLKVVVAPGEQLCLPALEEKDTYQAPVSTVTGSLFSAALMMDPVARSGLLVNDGEDHHTESEQLKVAIETLDRVQEQLQAKLAQDSGARTSLIQHSPPQSPPHSPISQQSPSPLQLSSSPSHSHTTPPSTPPSTQSPLVSPPRQTSPPPSESIGSSPVKHLTAQLTAGTSTAVNRTQDEELNRTQHEDEQEEDSSEEEEEMRAEESEEESMNEEENDSHILIHQSPCTSGSSSPHSTSPKERDSPISQISLPSITNSPVSVIATSSSSSSEDELLEEGKTEDDTKDSITISETSEHVLVDQPASHADGDRSPHKPRESSPIEQRRVKETPWTPVQMPNFFMPPHELEQTMRSLRTAALSRPQPRPLGTSTADHSSSHEHPPTAAATRKPLEPVCVSQTERDRIARIFSSSTTK